MLRKGQCTHAVPTLTCLRICLPPCRTSGAARRCIKPPRSTRRHACAGCCARAPLSTSAIRKGERRWINRLHVCSANSYVLVCLLVGLLFSHVWLWRDPLPRPGCPGMGVPCLPAARASQPFPPANPCSDTALHCAALRDYDGPVQLLLTAGARPWATNAKAQTVVSALSPLHPFT